MANTTKPPRLAVGWLLDWLSQNGLSRKRLVAETRLEFPAQNSAANLPVADYLALFNYAATTLGNDCIGISVGSSIDLSDFGFAGQLAHHCATLRDSWQAAEKYVGTVSPLMSVKLVEAGISSRIGYDVISVPSKLCRQDVEMSVVTFVRFIRAYAGETWLPDSVGFKHSAPQDLSAYHSLFGQDVRFDQPANTLVFPSAVLDTRVSHSDPALLAILREHADSLLADLDRKDNLVAMLRFSIVRTIGTDLCNAGVVARSLFMSPRTMNRHLKRLDTSFRRLKQSIIEEIAKDALLNSPTSVIEIALKLGYAESAAFDRAFKKNTGLTPMEYRRTIAVRR